MDFARAHGIPGGGRGTRIGERWHPESCPRQNGWPQGTTRHWHIRIQPDGHPNDEPIEACIWWDEQERRYLDERA